VTQTDVGSWRDPGCPVDERDADLLGRMTLDEKLAQLGSVWMGAAGGGGDVAPMQDLFFSHDGPPLDELIKCGIGQLTRVFGTRPVAPAEGVRALTGLQSRVVAASRFGIPAVAHEECLAGFAAWQATIYPVPLAWGACFHPALVGEMAARIGRDLRSVGVHQGLAPVLDVVRDPRWGRVEETIGEDPCLVGSVGSAYVRGLQSAGVVATLKHFAGYAASAGARNHAPVRAGGREFADVILPPFEYAVRVAGARSVMQSYAEIDGVPTAADAGLLTGLLRDTWDFTGTVVSDYFAIGFLHSAHGVAADEADAACQALTAGVDVELPTVNGYGERLVAAVERGEIAEEYVDRAVWRVLMQKCELGLLDRDWSPVPPALRGPAAGAVGALPEPRPGSVDLDPPENRALARQLAEESVILLDNKAGLLPLRVQGAEGVDGFDGFDGFDGVDHADTLDGAGDVVREIAVVGPLADEAAAMLGCYSFPAHVGPQYPDTPAGVGIPSVLEALRAELPGVTITAARGCEVSGPSEDPDEFPHAVASAAGADVCVAVLGDHSGLFGRGTSGEGCDAPDLNLPGEQGELLEALLATGTPVVLVLTTGRPYALGRYADRLAAVVQAFFPGEEGGPAIAGVLSGRVNPSGRLPVSMPRTEGGQPWTYLQPRLGLLSSVSSIDPTPLYPFGHGLSYTSFDWADFAAGPRAVAVDGTFEVELTVRNSGSRAGSEVVQLYLHDPVAQTTRPWARLIGFAKVALEPGEAKRVRLTGHADLTAFTGRAGRRIVEPGDIELWLAASSGPDAIRHRALITLTGHVREPGGRGGRCGEEDVPCRIACDVVIQPAEPAEPAG
jgi:beta-xylosidase